MNSTDILGVVSIVLFVIVAVPCGLVALALVAEVVTARLKGRESEIASGLFPPRRSGQLLELLAKPRNRREEPARGEASDQAPGA